MPILCFKCIKHLTVTDLFILQLCSIWKMYETHHKVLGKQGPLTQLYGFLKMSHACMCVYTFSLKDGYMKF